MARTRRPRPGADLTFGVVGALGTGIPQQRLGVEMESGLGESAGLFVAAHHREFGDYDSPEGEVSNSGSRDSGFLVSYAQLAAGGFFTLAVQGDYGREVERPRTNSDVVRFYYPTEDSLRLTTAYETGPVLGFDSTALSLFVGDYDIVTDQDEFATATTPRQILRADVAARDFGLRGDAVRHWGGTSVHFGLDFNGRFDLEAHDITIDFDRAGMRTQDSSAATIEEARRIDAGVYVSAARDVGRSVGLAGGLRYDRIRSTNEGGFFGDRSTTNAEPSGYFGVTLGPFDGFSTTLQYARGFRDARLSDRFFRGVTGAGFITGNPDLESETSDQYDLALRWNDGRWHPAIYVYHYRIDDLIERFSCATTPLPPPCEDQMEPDSFFFRNRGRAEIQGIELELQAELPQRLSLLVSGSVAGGEALDDGTPLDDIAPENVAIQLRRALRDRGWIQLRTAWTGELDEPGPNEVIRDAHTLVDAGAGWRLMQGVELQLFLRNAFDESYLLTADSRSPLAPGRSAVLSAHCTF
jgi:outer membrane receptor protein involved in Fe transport